MKNAFEYDSAMRVSEPELQGMSWVSAFDDAIGLHGFAWNTDKQIFRRLPPNEKGDIPEAVDHLANNCSGGQLRFKTTSKRVAVAVELAGPAGMYHMPATGQCGCDLYVKQDGQFIFYGVTRIDPKKDQYNCLLYAHQEDAEREFLINMPLYQAVTSLRIGIDEGSTIEAVRDYKKRIVIYGTSITQGGCAARPGMSTPNLLSRMLHCEFINLGFSGNGKGEPALARYINDVADTDLIILDYQANTGYVGIGKTLPEFVRILREQNATLPILIISKPPYAHNTTQANDRQRTDAEIAYQRDFVAGLVEAGDAHIHFLDGSSAIESEFMDGTVDGTHPTDLGFYLMAKHWAPEIRRLLDL